MPPGGELSKHAFSEVTEACPPSFGDSNRYENVSLAGNSSAVVGNVVHQHFYSPSHDSVVAGDHGRGQVVELRSNIEQLIAAKFDN